MASFLIVHAVPHYRPFPNALLLANDGPPQSRRPQWGLVFFLELASCAIGCYPNTHSLTVHHHVLRVLARAHQL